MASLGWSNAQIEIAYKRLEDDAVISLDNCPKPVFDILAAAVSCVMFVTPSSDEVLMATKGVPAGTPLADVLFNLLMSRIIACYRLEAGAAGLIPTFTAACDPTTFSPTCFDGACSVSDASYLDDLVLLLGDTWTLLVSCCPHHWMDRAIRYTDPIHVR